VSTSYGSQPHHDGSAQYVDDQAPSIGDRVPVRLRVPAGCAADAVHLRTVIDAEPDFSDAAIIDNEPGIDGATWWQAELAIGGPTASYRFLIETAAGPQWVNGAGTWTRDVADRDDFVLSTHAPPPDWLAETVAYQVFPDRFARSAASFDDPAPAGDWAIECAWDQPVASDWTLAVRQLYRGDLVGVRERLDHLERLGVNLIYLTPYFPAGSSHRYDAVTFDHADPVLGGDVALSALVDAAHARNIRVIGDLTTNHSGNRHRWFEAAQADATSPEASFYFFDDHPDEYVGWFNVSTLPKFDLRSTTLRHRLVDGPDSIVGRWLANGDGLDGWRIDVGNMTGRLGPIDVNHDVFRDVRRTMAAVRPDAWLVGEHCHDATADLAGDGWHGVMAYTWFTRPVWSWLGDRNAEPLSIIGVPGGLPAIGGREFVETYRALTAGVPWRSVAASMTLLDSHDTARFTSVSSSSAHHRVGVGLLMTMPGVPMVFAGDEVGVRGDTSDTGRQPFPWDAATWDQELFDAYRDLIAIRRGSEALKRGGLRFVADGPDAFAFVREVAEERVLVLAARAPHASLVVTRGDLGYAGAVECLYGDGELLVDSVEVTLPGHGPAFGVWRFQ